MKTFKKILRVLLLLLVIIVVAAFFIVRHIARKGLPDYTKPVAIEGLTGEVTVYRDQYAVPHIYADNEHDLYLTTGYLLAQDRLWQMDLLRRVTQGRLSEIFGAGLIDADHLLRSLRIPEKSDLVLLHASPEISQALEAFSKGVNQFIADAGNRLPPEFTILGYKPEPWEPQHSVNLIGYMAWDLTGSWGTEITLFKLQQKLDEEKWRQLIPDFSHQSTFVHSSTYQKLSDHGFDILKGNEALQRFGLEIFSASNNWAVSGRKSETGHPLLSNDMHLGFGAPGIWYQMHQVVEGRLNVTGVVLPGQPFVIVGHNERIAWGMTNLYVDDMDFYIETINPEDDNYYLFNGEWKKLQVREEKINVKGSAAVTRINRFTHRGPVISSFKNLENYVVSMRWSGNEFSNEIRSIYLLNRAGNWDQFRDALSTFSAVSQNVIYADVDGNIGLQTAGGVPLRKTGTGIFVVPGDTDKYDWDGMLPFEMLPFTFNPPEGHVSSANNRTIGEDYPYVIGHWFDLPSRIDRIREMLNAKEKLRIGDFMEMLGDIRSKHVEDHLPDMLAILQVQPNLSSNEKTALNYLTEWDLTMRADLQAPAIFEKFYLQFARNLMSDEMGETLYTEFIGTKSNVRNLVYHVWANRNSPWIDDISTAQTETFDSLIVKSFREAIGWFEKELGSYPAKWKWGKIHQLTLKHQMGTVKILDLVFNMNKGPFPVGGSYHTVNPLAYSFRNPFEPVHGASQRHIFNPARWEESYVIIPTGISGIPASRHYLDQTNMFVNNEFRKDLWLSGDVVKNARYVQVFSPK